MSTVLKLNDSLIKFTPAGIVTKKDVLKTGAALGKFLEDHSVRHIMIDLSEVKSVEPSAFREDLVMQKKYKDKFDKIAIVGAPKALYWFIELSNTLFRYPEHNKIKNFDDTESAMKWFESK